jgi:LacI family transcriptional regulator
MDRPATLSDVARLAGVSTPTASRVLNPGVRGGASGRDEIRQRVTAAAESLGYSASSAAQATKGGRSRSVALIVRDIDDFGSARMIAGVMRAAESLDVAVAVRSTHDDSVDEADILRSLRGERHRGVILATSRTTNARRERQVGEQLAILQRQGANVVIIGDTDLPYPRLTVNNRQAAAELAEQLVRRGRRRFAIAAGPADQLTARERAAGFLDGLARSGIVVADHLVVHSEFSRSGGSAAAARLAEYASELDVIAAMSDTMAVGVISGLRDAQLTVPGDIDVTGFDHVPLIGDLVPGFSTVDIPFDQFGRTALGLVLETGPSTVREITMAATTIVEGEPLQAGNWPA